MGLGDLRGKVTTTQQYAGPEARYGRRCFGFRAWGMLPVLSPPFLFLEIVIISQRLGPYI